VASAISRWRVFAGELCPPLEPQGPNLLIFALLFKVIAAEPQAVVIVFAFALCTLFSSPQRILFLLVFLVAVLLIVILVVLVLAIVLLGSFEASSLLVAYEFDNGTLVDTVLLVVKRKTSAIQNGSQPFPSSIRVGFGVSEEFELGVDVAVIVGCVGPGDVYRCDSRVTVYRKVDSFPNVAYCWKSLVRSQTYEQITRSRN
jgi:hypothetical protein